jgi:hypothetical protein
VDDGISLAHPQAAKALIEGGADMNIASKSGLLGTNRRTWRRSTATDEKNGVTNRGKYGNFKNYWDIWIYFG